MLKEADIHKGDLAANSDEAWNMRKAMWHIYDLAMDRFKESSEAPGWKMKFVRSKAQALTFVREGQHKELDPILRDLEEKERLFNRTIFEPYFKAIMNIAVAQPALFGKQGGGKLDGESDKEAIHTLAMSFLEPEMTRYTATVGPVGAGVAAHQRSAARKQRSV